MGASKVRLGGGGIGGGGGGEEVSADIFTEQHKGAAG